MDLAQMFAPAMQNPADQQISQLGDLLRQLAEQRALGQRTPGHPRFWGDEVDSYGVPMRVRYSTDGARENLFQTNTTGYRTGGGF